VSGACFLSGFGSLSNFLEAFKKECGMTPREYKNKAIKSSIIKENISDTEAI
jgi:AraC-like DNA-binding protein